jgi:hypothetical protein
MRNGPSSQGKREMIARLRRVWERVTTTPPQSGFHFNRPLLVFQSDDWGRVGVRDQQGWEELEAGGLHLGEAPYDYYTLETAEDLNAIGDVLRRYQDSVGRNPALVMNFILANVDFDRSLQHGENEISLVPLTAGLPGQWRRPQLFESYRQGVQDGVFFPALHGLTHFNSKAVSRELNAGGERADLIRKLWSAQTPYIHWRMPWIGYEYWDREQDAKNRSLSLEEQRKSIHQAAEVYQRLFGIAPLSACAPGYRANDDTRTAWFEDGIRVAQNGPGETKRPFLDHRGMLHTFRTIEMEPAIATCSLGDLVKQAQECFDCGVPAIVSIHSINFHSSLRDFRTPTLALLDQFLAAVKKKWPDVLYVQDSDLFHIATEGCYQAHGVKVALGATLVEGKA